MTGFNSEDAGRSDLQYWIIRDDFCTSEIRTDANGGDHVGEIDERSGGVVGKFVTAWRDWGVACFFENGADGSGVGSFVLLRNGISTASAAADEACRAAYLGNHANVVTEARWEASRSVLGIGEVLKTACIQGEFEVFQVESEL